MATRKKKSPLQAYIDKIPPYLTNRYFLVLVAFVAWMVFLDRHDVMTQFQLRSSVNHLEEELEGFDEKIAGEEAAKQHMESNRERFARESYYMQKDDEDVFIIVPER